jgi:RNA polymerase-associated protein LEO1
MSSEDDLMANGGDDLFDDDEDEDEIEQKTRELSDRELDSGDDEGRDDRAPKAEEPDFDSGRDARILDTTIWRHPLPKPADGEVRALIAHF